jgi:hypothetical protein
MFFASAFRFKLNHFRHHHLRHPEERRAKPDASRRTQLIEFFYPASASHLRHHHVRHPEERRAKPDASRRTHLVSPATPTARSSPIARDQRFLLRPGPALHPPFRIDGVMDGLEFLRPDHLHRPPRGRIAAERPRDVVAHPTVQIRGAADVVGPVRASQHVGPSRQRAFSNLRPQHDEDGGN